MKKISVISILIILGYVYTLNSSKQNLENVSNQHKSTKVEEKREVAEVKLSASMHESDTDHNHHHHHSSETSDPKKVTEDVLSVYENFDSEAFFSGLNETEVSDITVIPEVFSKMVEKLDSIDNLAKALFERGYNPRKQKRGHPKVGVRQVVTLAEVGSEQGLLKEFYSSYLESGKGELVFDRFYYGMQAREGVFEQIVKSIDSGIGQKALSKEVKNGFVRWNFGEDLFVFVNSEYELGGEAVVLVGHEFEIH